MDGEEPFDEADFEFGDVAFECAVEFGDVSLGGEIEFEEARVLADDGFGLGLGHAGFHQFLYVGVRIENESG